LRIAIDVRRLGEFGYGTYIRNLVRGLAGVDSVNHYILIAGKRTGPDLESLPPNFETVTYRRPEGRLLTEITYPLFLRHFEADVHHMPLAVVPLAMPRPYVVTIHDMGSLLFAQKRGVGDNLRLFRFRRGLRNADRVIAVSNATRRDVENLLRIPAGRIRTIYNAPDPIFCEAHSGAAAPDMQRILDRYHIHYPFLLYAGRTNPQKNIPRLVEAFAVIRGELAQHPLYKDLRLIIIGDEISKYPSLRHAVIASRVEDVVRFLGFVPIETLRVFYQTAAAFVFPSLYEGFGLPPLEAMACGAPVVASGVSALPEVLGDAAVTVNPENVFDIARGVREVLLNRELRAALIRKGFEQVKRFSWRRTAEQALETYSEVASLRSTPR
jgi:glycosyltransferase involved in cell wall biosynthesis